MGRPKSYYVLAPDNDTVHDDELSVLCCFLDAVSCSQESLWELNTLGQAGCHMDLFSTIINVPEY